MKDTDRIIFLNSPFLVWHSRGILCCIYMHLSLHSVFYFFLPCIMELTTRNADKADEYSIFPNNNTMAWQFIMSEEKILLSKTLEACEREG